MRDACQSQTAPIMKVSGLLGWKSLDVGVFGIEVFYRSIHIKCSDAM